MVEDGLGGRWWLGEENQSPHWKNPASKPCTSSSSFTLFLLWFLFLLHFLLFLFFFLPLHFPLSHPWSLSQVTETRDGFSFGLGNNPLKRIGPHFISSLSSSLATHRHYYMSFTYCEWVLALSAEIKFGISSGSHLRPTWPFNYFILINPC